MAHVAVFLKRAWQWLFGRRYMLPFDGHLAGTEGWKHYSKHIRCGGIFNRKRKYLYLGYDPSTAKAITAEFRLTKIIGTDDYYVDNVVLKS